MMPLLIDHYILDRIYRLLMGVNHRGPEPIIGDVVRESECIEFTDDTGDWEIVVREIEGGRD